MTRWEYDQLVAECVAIRKRQLREQGFLTRRERQKAWQDQQEAERLRAQTAARAQAARDRARMKARTRTRKTYVSPYVHGRWKEAGQG